MKNIIKFKQGDLLKLRTTLLKDLSKEYFAILLGKTEIIDDITIIKIIEIKILQHPDYVNQNYAHLHLNKECIAKIIVETQNRFDVDTIIDVHTHPFAERSVAFSGIDDRDEKNFCIFLEEKFDNIFYASIVLSQTEYSARVWNSKNKKARFENAVIKTQTEPENIASSDLRKIRINHWRQENLLDNKNIFNRSTLALGIENMRKIMNDQVITIVGIGGLGSIIAEHLVHMGFHQINLIDKDKIEFSSLNRIVGAYYEDAKNQTSKVDAIKRHLKNINPEAKVNSFENDIYDKEMEKIIVLSDWLIVATDNHSSRYKAQELSIKYFVPIISVGVNITVFEEQIFDMSGEVITSRVGDNLCLHCLKRINPINVAYELSPSQDMKEELVSRGYIKGADIKEPAVKTLNSILATMTVDVLINQYTQNQQHKSILVYENNGSKCIYEDLESKVVGFVKTNFKKK